MKGDNGNVMRYETQDGCLSSAGFLNGCTSVALNAGFDEVKATVEERSAIKIFWNNGTDLDKEAAEKAEFVA